MTRAQTALEYLLMIAGGVLLSAVVMVVVNNNLNMAAGGIDTSNYTGNLHTYLETVYVDDGDWVKAGNNEFVAVDGNVGIGTNNPGAKLDVNGNVSIAGNMKLTGSADLSNNRITDLAPPIGGRDAVNKDYVDALSDSSGANITINDSHVYVSGALQSTEVYAMQGNYISTVPLSFPKGGCGLKITACSTAANAYPTSLIIGADPVTRITKSPINQGTTAVNPIVGANFNTAITCGVGASNTSFTTQCDDDGTNCIQVPNRVSLSCPTGWTCSLANANMANGQGYYNGYCCPNGVTYAQIAYFGSYPWYVTKCFSCAGGDQPDLTNGVCYHEPRCNAGTGGVDILQQYSLTENTCVYCPVDHPTYDAVSKNCIKSSTVSTTGVGQYCSTLSLTLPSAFTDVTFMTGAAVTPVSYVMVAHSCT
jgi:hypothetical protein